MRQNKAIMKLKAAFLFIASMLLVYTGKAQIYGCTDSLAVNFNPAATINDGSCIYDQTSIEPLSSFVLSSQVAETSGLIFWNGCLWTHNDNTDTRIYGLDTINGQVVQSYLLNNISNYDWEEISQDSNFLYIGDFGNNLNGNRTDLRILRISKMSLLENNPVIDTISFSYSDQVDFTPAGANNTDFDCEAIIVSSDSIYLFTKQWISKGTSVYSLPKTPGVYMANHVAGYDVDGLVTGATCLERQRLLLLCGYSSLLSPFTWLLYDYKDQRFFSGNKRKIGLSLPFHQVEAVCTGDGLKIYMTNESFSRPPFINTPQQLHIFNFSPLLARYLNNYTMTVEVLPGQKDVFICTNPASGYIRIQTPDNFDDQDFVLLNAAGKRIRTGKVTGKEALIDVSTLPRGIYLLSTGERIGSHAIRLIIR